MQRDADDDSEYIISLINEANGTMVDRDLLVYRAPESFRNKYKLSKKVQALSL